MSNSRGYLSRGTIGCNSRVNFLTLRLKLIAIVVILKGGVSVSSNSRYWPMIAILCSTNNQ